MASLHEKEDNHKTTDERKEYGAEDRYSSEPQKAHLTGEFVILWKFGDFSSCNMLIGCFFRAEILGARVIFGDPHLNSTTVLFDKVNSIINEKTFKALALHAEKLNWMQFPSEFNFQVANIPKPSDTCTGKL